MPLFYLRADATGERKRDEGEFVACCSASCAHLALLLIRSCGDAFGLPRA